MIRILTAMVIPKTAMVAYQSAKVILKAAMIRFLAAMVIPKIAMVVY